MVLKAFRRRWHHHYVTVLFLHILRRRGAFEDQLPCGLVEPGLARSQPGPSDLGAPLVPLVPCLTKAWDVSSAGTRTVSFRHLVVTAWPSPAATGDLKLDRTPAQQHVPPNRKES